MFSWLEAAKRRTSVVQTATIPTPYARNTDRAGKEYRPVAQGNTDPWRKGIPTSRAKTAEDTDLSRK
jgi:hypothetical protein